MAAYELDRPAPARRPLERRRRPSSAGWRFTSLRVLHLDRASTARADPRARGRARPARRPLPRGGRGSTTWAARSRGHVFAGMPWALYLPRDTALPRRGAGPSWRSAVRGASAAASRCSSAGGRSRSRCAGSGNATRQINHIVKPEFPAERLLVVEVFTPSGNWSSYPPHKHDEDNAAGRGRARGDLLLPDGAPPEAFAVQRLYSPSRGLDVTRDGARRRPAARAVRLPPDRGRARLRPLLPERARRRAPLDGRRGRSRPRLDPRRLARWSRSPGTARHARGPRADPVANAPVSYGAFELTVGVLPNVPGPEEVLAAVADAGYEGIELGPPGYLGDDEVLRARLERFGSKLAGGFIQVRFSHPEHWDEDLAVMAETLDLLAAGDGRDARPVLADFGSPARVANPGRAARTALAWTSGMAAARRRGRTCHRAGACTRLRADLPPPCGHLRRSAVGDRAAARADRRRATARHRSPRPRRRRSATSAPGLARAHQPPPRQGRPSRRGAAQSGTAPTCRSAGAAASSVSSGPATWISTRSSLSLADSYTGWLVVEQDWVPGPRDDVSGPARAQARNRSWLREHAGL